MTNLKKKKADNHLLVGTRTLLKCIYFQIHPWFPNYCAVLPLFDFTLTNKTEFTGGYWKVDWPLWNAQDNKHWGELLVSESTVFLLVFFIQTCSLALKNKITKLSLNIRFAEEKDSKSLTNPVKISCNIREIKREQYSIKGSAWGTAS